MIVEFKTELEKEWFFLTSNHHGFIEKGGVLSYEDSAYTIEKFSNEKDYLAKLEELNIVK